MSLSPYNTSLFDLNIWKNPSHLTTTILSLQVPFAYLNNYSNTQCCDKPKCKDQRMEKEARYHKIHSASNWTFSNVAFNSGGQSNQLFGHHYQNIFYMDRKILRTDLIFSSPNNVRGHSHSQVMSLNFPAQAAFA